LDFEDNFLPCVERQGTSFKAAGIDFSEECGLCDIPEPSMAHIQDANFVAIFESNGSH